MILLEKEKNLHFGVYKSIHLVKKDNVNSKYGLIDLETNSIFKTKFDYRSSVAGASDVINFWRCVSCKSCSELNSYVVLERRTKRTSVVIHEIN